MPCSVICISHATGSGGDEVGRLVADRLSFLHVDEEIIATAAARGGVSPADVADEERRKSLAARILGTIAEGGAGAMALGGAIPYPLEDERPSSEIRALIREAIEQTAARGDVVITAHAASHALDYGPRVLRVLVTASPDTRAKRVSERAGIDVGKAKRVVSNADAARREYLKRFYDVDHELPTHYDLVLNTDTLSVEDAAELIAHSAARP
jgi:Cytidylate kinase-like family